MPGLTRASIRVPSAALRRPLVRALICCAGQARLRRGRTAQHIAIWAHSIVLAGAVRPEVCSPHAPGAGDPRFRGDKPPQKARGTARQKTRPVLLFTLPSSGQRGASRRAVAAIFAAPGPRFSARRLVPPPACGCDPFRVAARASLGRTLAVRRQRAPRSGSLCPRAEPRRRPGCVACWPRPRAPRPSPTSRRNRFTAPRRGGRGGI